MTRRALSVFIGMVGLVTSLSLIVAGSTLSTNTRQDQSQILTCRRVNVLRAQSNLTDIAAFRVYSRVGREQMRLYRIDKEPLRRDFAEFLFEQARRVWVTAPTHCHEAVRNPLTYIFPVAEPIGNPRTGKLTSNAQFIEQRSLTVKINNTTP